MPKKRRVVTSKFLFVTKQGVKQEYSYIKYALMLKECMKCDPLFQNTELPRLERPCTIELTRFSLVVLNEGTQYTRGRSISKLLKNNFAQKRHTSLSEAFNGLDGLRCKKKSIFSTEFKLKGNNEAKNLH